MKKDRSLRALITSILTVLGLTASLGTGLAVAWASDSTEVAMPTATATTTATTVEVTPELPVVDPLVVSLPDSALTATAAASVRISARTLMALQIAKAKQPSGARMVAKRIAKAKHGWGNAQFDCLNRLWTKESGWRYRANNSRTGAYGIPQAHPGSKMASVARDWRSNPVTQIRWGLRYIESRYNSPCAAWSKFKRSNWY